MKRAAISVLLLLAVMTWPALAGQVIHDGDSIKLDGVRVRLWGIDAPELGEMCERAGHIYDAGVAARDALADLVGGRAIACEPVELDRHKRTVARCSVDGLDLSGALARAGWAYDFTRYSGGHYKREESEAREAGRGLWGGYCPPPWEWRRERRGMKAQP